MEQKLKGMKQTREVIWNSTAQNRAEHKAIK